MSKERKALRQQSCRVWIALALLAASVLTGAAYLLWLDGWLLPYWARWQSGSSQTADGSLELRLEGRRACLWRGDELFWQSDEKSRVQTALFCDIDRDGQEEIVLLSWRRGRYGDAKPIWVEKNDDSWSQHIFVYEYDDEKVRPKWMSSYLGTEAVQLQSGSAEYTRHQLFLEERGGGFSCWQWDSWGFVRQETELSLAAFGDNLIHEALYRYGLQQGSFDFLFSNVKAEVEASDLAIINQETPFVAEDEACSDFPQFGTPLLVARAIADAGFDVVTLATNHALDQGMEGIDLTRETLTELGLCCLGTQTSRETEYLPYTVLQKKGIRLALLNYSYGANGRALPAENPHALHLLDEEQVRRDLQEAGKAADMVVVFVHWGTENSTEIDDFQKQWTQLFWEEGVDLVIGTHPHVLQPVELRREAGREMLVFYSLGNFVSAQSQKTAEKGGMARVTLSLSPDGYHILDYSVEPLMIEWQPGGYFVPNWLPK